MTGYIFPSFEDSASQAATAIQIYKMMVDSGGALINYLAFFDMMTSHSYGSGTKRTKPIDIRIFSTEDTTSMEEFV